MKFKVTLNKVIMPHKLIIVNVKSCGSCKSFTSKYLSEESTDSLPNKVAKLDNVDYIQVNLDRMNKLNFNSKWREVPQMIYSLIKWYPFVMLISEKDWAAGLSGEDINDKVFVYDPRTNVVDVNADGKLTTEDIMKWVNVKLSGLEDTPKSYFSYFTSLFY